MTLRLTSCATAGKVLNYSEINILICKTTLLLLVLQDHIKIKYIKGDL